MSEKFNIEEKANVLIWLISAQGLEGIPSIKDGYYLTPEEIVERYKAEVDDNGFLVPVNVQSLYYKNGKRIVCSELPQNVVIDISLTDLNNIKADPIEILPAAPEGFSWITSQVIVDSMGGKVETKAKLN